MTIVTKPISEKKPEDKEKILLDPNVAIEVNTNDDEPTEELVILRARLRRINSHASVCLLLSLVLIITTCVMSGNYLFRQYQNQRLHQLKVWCRVPYDDVRGDSDLGDAEFAQLNDRLEHMVADQMLSDASAFDALQAPNREFDVMNERIAKDMAPDSRFFKEQFELDLANESYEKIYVPDFQGGHKGRFVHDFNTNKTGIIDITNHRCFVMPLNHDAVLPPRSLFDLIMKMWDGYYDVNTEVVRETMRVVEPPITDPKEMGVYISRECFGMDVYRLEKINSTRIAKRSIEASQPFNFVVYSGEMIKYEIHGLDQLAKKD